LQNRSARVCKSAIFPQFSGCFVFSPGFFCQFFSVQCCFRTVCRRAICGLLITVFRPQAQAIRISCGLKLVLLSRVLFFTRPISCFTPPCGTLLEPFCLSANAFSLVSSRSPAQIPHSAFNLPRCETKRVSWLPPPSSFPPPEFVQTDVPPDKLLISPVRKVVNLTLGGHCDFLTLHEVKQPFPDFPTRETFLAVFDSSFGRDAFACNRVRRDRFRARRNTFADWTLHILFLFSWSFMTGSKVFGSFCSLIIARSRHFGFFD